MDDLRLNPVSLALRGRLRWVFIRISARLTGHVRLTENQMLIGELLASSPNRSFTIEELSRDLKISPEITEGALRKLVQDRLVLQTSFADRDNFLAVDATALKRILDRNQVDRQKNYERAIRKEIARQTDLP